jgi:hypothetical protein
VGHMDVSPIVVATVAVVVAALWFFFVRRKTPSEKTFKCARCKAVSAHSARTINAWREGKTKFFCGSCHAEWLRTHPAARKSASARGSNSGCLGVLACLALVPLAIVVVWLYA